MSELKDVKTIVKNKYAEIAKKADIQVTEGCSCGCDCGPSSVDYSTFSDNYKMIEGYVPEADLGLGCGLPTQFANIQKDDVVVDLGSGAGNDVFIARSIVGEKGQVIGIDMTEEMVNKARMNSQKLGYNNVEFKLGDIENMPIDDNSVDVVVSNCVLNLVPDKKRAYTEIFRILKPGAHFCISDIVIKGELSEALQQSAELYAGCVAGALELDEYLNAIEEAGFKDINIDKKKSIDLPDVLLKNFLSENEVAELQNSEFGIYSITVSGYKM
jgi:SAM-dependent methyltransferase